MKWQSTVLATKWLHSLISSELFLLEPDLMLTWQELFIDGLQLRIWIRWFSMTRFKVILQWACWEESSMEQRVTMFCSRDCAGIYSHFISGEFSLFSLFPVTLVFIVLSSKDSLNLLDINLDIHLMTIVSVTRGMLSSWMDHGDLFSVIGEQDIWCKLEFVKVNYFDWAIRRILPLK